MRFTDEQLLELPTVGSGVIHFYRARNNGEFFGAICKPKFGHGRPRNETIEFLDIPIDINRFFCGTLHADRVTCKNCLRSLNRINR